jgi:outer membrane immunogenic protein
MRKTFLGLVAAVSATGTAHAEGGWVEIHGGLDSLDRRGESSTEDGFGGIGAGYDFPVNDKTFIGIEANLDESGAKITNRVQPVFGLATVRANRDINVNVRVGKTVGASGKTKVYALAGYANLRVKAKIVGPQGTISGSASADGYRVGLGAERNISKRAYAKVEYRFTNYEGGFTRSQGLIGVGFRL